MLEAAVQAGLRANPDLNGERQDGVGRFQLTQRGGLRCSTADAYLHPAAGRPNLEVRDCSFVERIVFEGDRAVGVDAVRNGVRETVRAGREVIVSAGAYQSPVLLMLSGIGLAEELEPFGIPVRRTFPSGATSRTTAWRTQLPHRRVRRCSGLHAGELRAPRERGPRAAHARTTRGWRLLPHAARACRRRTSSSTSRRRSSSTRA